MKKYIKYIIVLAIIVVLVIAHWLISPLFITREVSEKLEDIPEMTLQAPAAKIIAQGKFEGVSAHNAEGTATLLKIGDKYYVRFEDNFKVTNGPDLFVYFGKDGQYDSNTKIAALKGNVGGQNYEVPANINPSNYSEVWVWCRAFSVGFGKAALK